MHNQQFFPQSSQTDSQAYSILGIFKVEKKKEKKEKKEIDIDIGLVFFSKIHLKKVATPTPKKNSVKYLIKHVKF